MNNNPIQFAVVREDPRVESVLIERLATRRMLTVASGGCTALTLGALYPELELTLVDPNKAQLELVRNKAAALLRSTESERRALFNIEDDRPDGLNQCGNFESLFRSLRHFLLEFVAPREAFETLFSDRDALGRVDDLLFGSPWWPVAFRTFFGDDLLATMFGPDAIQHAAPGSYPGYFRELFERGLRRPDAFDNYFLHHVLLGRYLDRATALPDYLVNPVGSLRFELLETTLGAAPRLETYDLVGLSNIMDWMDDDAIQALAGRLGDALRPGAAVLYRQLNNDDDLEAVFGERFRFDPALGAGLLGLDRSLFYQSIHVGIRSQT